MNVLIDTHALLWFLTKSPSLSQQARISIEKSLIIYITTIVLLEFMYLLQKKGQINKFSIFLKTIKNSNRYVIIALDTAVVESVSKISQKLEIHDKIILATAKLLKTIIITKDESIRKNYSKSIW